MGIVLNTLKRTLENVKATAISLNNELKEFKDTMEAKQKNLDATFGQVQELERAIKQLEKPDASKNKKTK